MASAVDVPALKRRLQTVGILPPSSSDDHEGWRNCLVELCGRYLGSQEPPTKEPGSEVATVSVPTAVQIAALRMRVEDQRKRNLELSFDLDRVTQREKKLRRVVDEDPVLRSHSLADFVVCLKDVQQRLPLEAVRTTQDETDFAEFLKKVDTIREKHLPPEAEITT